MSRHPMLARLSLALLIAAGLGLSGCGRKGPLEPPPDASVAAPPPGQPGGPPPPPPQRQKFFLDFLL